MDKFVKLARTALQAISRRYPLYSGNMMVAGLLPMRLLTSSPEQVVTRLRDGSPILVQLNDYIGRTLYFCGDYDPKITWLCQRLLRPGDCFVDVGANMGVVSLYAAKLVGPTGRVHAFEPQPDLAEGIRKSVALCGHSHVTVHALALSDCDGVLPLYVREGESAVSSLNSLHAPGRRAVDVPVKAAGAYLESLELPRIRLLKIDVEDHEDEVLRGAASFLKETFPPAIAFESHGRGVPFFERAPVKRLAELGYGFYRIPKAAVRMRLVAIPDGTAHVGRGFDFVAVSREPRDEDVRRALGVSRPSTDASRSNYGAPAAQSSMSALSPGDRRAGGCSGT